MTNQMQIFENKEFGKIRIIEIQGQPWWILRDVCAALELNSPHKVAERLDEDERNLIPVIDSLGRKQDTSIINESGLYAVILRSDKPNAKTFRRWITSEVLPSIRKHGAYIADDVLSRMYKDSAFSDELVQKLTDERAKSSALLGHIEKLAPKARYCDIVLQSANSVQTSILAKDYGMTCIAFNKLLHALNIQYRIGDCWLLYKEHDGRGYTDTKTFYTPHGYAKIHTQWTQRGRWFIYSLLKQHGIIPLAEQEAIFAKC